MKFARLIAFLIIGSSPLKFRPLMIPAVLEKLGYVGMLVQSSLWRRS